MERVLEVGRLVRREHAHEPVVLDHPGQLGHVGLGVGEVLDEVGRAGAVEAPRQEAQAERVHLGHPQPVGPVAGRPPCRRRRRSSRPRRRRARAPGSGPTRSPGRSPRRGCARRRCDRERRGSRPRAARAASPVSPPAAGVRPSAGSSYWWPRRSLRCTVTRRVALPAYTTRRPTALHDHTHSPPPHATRASDAHRGGLDSLDTRRNVGGRISGVVVLAALAYVPAARGAARRRHAEHQDRISTSTRPSS